MESHGCTEYCLRVGHGQTEIFKRSEISYENRQIVVVKGWEGFADRLQILSHSMQYCIQNNAVLCVDWRDEMWGQGDTDFNDYFDIIGVETTTMNVVINRIQTGATCFPASWTVADLSAPMTKYIHMKHKVHKTEDMFPEYKKREYDILVIKNGLRTYHITNLVNHLRFTQNVADAVQANLARVILPFTAVHLRGTDRIAEPAELSINKTIAKFLRLPKYQQSRVYVLSDMKSLIDLWVAQHPASIHTNPNNSISKIDMGDGAEKSCGSHMLPKEVYEYYGIIKREMNIDTLTDFVVLAMADWCIGNMETESCFTKMARFIYNNTGSDGIVAWMDNSYFPKRASFIYYTDRKEK